MAKKGCQHSDMGTSSDANGTPGHNGTLRASTSLPEKLGHDQFRLWEVKPRCLFWRLMQDGILALFHGQPNADRHSKSGRSEVCSSPTALWKLGARNLTSADYGSPIRPCHLRRFSGSFLSKLLAISMPI
jgi:hypothetical protein